MFSLRALALLLALSSPSIAFCQEYAPAPPEKPAWGIVEEYDEVVVATMETRYYWKNYPARTDISSRIYFGRNGKIIADRYLSDQHQFSQVDGKWIVFWRDGSWPDVDRVIITKSLGELRLKRVIREDEQTSSPEWWMQGNRMTDLESPPE